MDISWDDLPVYLAIRTHGSLAAAGRQLGLDATTVGRRLERLESGIGARLFHRTRDGLSLTGAGRTIEQHAQQMERSEALIERAVGGADARLAGSVRVAATEVFATAFLVKHLAAFRTACPDISLELVVQDRLVDLARGDVDVALRFASVDAGVPVPAGMEGELLATLLSPVNIGVYGSRGYLDRVGRPTTPYAVEGHTLVCPQPPIPYFPGADWVSKVQGRAPRALGIDSPGGLGAAVAAGFGLAALACYQAADHPELERVCAPAIVDSRHLWLLVPRELRRVARVRAVVDFLEETVATWSTVLTGV